MLKLMKYLKRSIIPILLILVLLGVEAYGDLSLPQYTSNLVNVGIQQDGIDSIVPQTIRKSEMDKITLFMEEKDKALISENYTETEGSSPLTLSLNKDIAEDTKDTLAAALEYPMVMVYGMEGGFSESGGDASAMMGNMSSAGLDLDTLVAMPQQQQAEMISVIKDKTKTLKDMDSSILQQMGINYVKAEYQACGIDLSELRSDYIWGTGGKMLAMALLIGICTVLVTFLAARVGAFFAHDLRKNVFSKVVRFSGGDFNKFSSASLITRCTNDIQQVQIVVILFLRMVLYAPIIGVGAFFMVLRSDTSMAWIIGVAVGLVLTVVMVLLIATMPKFKSLQRLVDKVNLVTREILTGLPVIRAFRREEHENSRFEDSNTELTDVNLFVNRAMAMMMPLMMLIMNGICVLIVWVGADAISVGSMQVGGLMAFIQYTMQIIMSFLIISMISIMLPRALVSANRIAEVLETENTIKESSAPKKFLKDFKKGVVEFENVSFRYPNAEEDILKNISFTAKPGETTAFIGSTGSGKSTVANLIPRFYDVTAGKILIDGVDIRNVSLFDLREKIGYVPQKATLFSGTVASNISYCGNHEVKNIKKAAAIAQAEDFIEEMEQGYKSPIAQGGTNVSGGQRQRLSIARAIAKNPEIYLFDDCFSALDYKTDAALRKALHEYTAESTVLIIAQRISTVINADTIVVLDDGEVAGIGTHQELMKTSEVYRQIALSQLSEEELAI